MNQPSLGAALTTVGLVLLMVLSLPPWQSYNPLLLMRTHERIEQDLDRVKAYLDERLRCGRVFCRLEWGEYLSWAFHPRYPVFMDGRIEIYPDDVWAEYRDVTTGQSNWQIVLDEYEVNVLVLDEEYHRGTGLWNQIAAASGWQ